jgi:hypothetical protein
VRRRPVGGCAGPLSEADSYSRGARPSSDDEVRSTVADALV